MFLSKAITETTKKECSGKTKEQKTTKSMLNSDVMLIQLGGIKTTCLF